MADDLADKPRVIVALNKVDALDDEDAGRKDRRRCEAHVAARSSRCPRVSGEGIARGAARAATARSEGRLRRGRRCRRGGAAIVASLTGARRLVVKIGSALLVDVPSGALRGDWLPGWQRTSPVCAGRGIDVVAGFLRVDRAGARRAGPGRRGRCRWNKAQAAAAVGQIRLARAYEEALAPHGIVTAQVLVTLEDSRRPPPLPEFPRHDAASAAARRRADRQRERHRSPRTKSGSATMTGWRRRWR